MNAKDTINKFAKYALNNCLSHAYLIVDMGIKDKEKLLFDIVKKILLVNKTEEDISNISSLIDKGNYFGLKIIKPDGMWIKKEQLIELQSNFSKESVSGNKQVYIIHECDKMNKHSANSLLKFLEEPSTDVVAFLVTNNLNSILPTIVSRCQIIRVKDEEVNTLVDSELYNKVLKTALCIEEKKLHSIVYMDSLWHNYFNDKQTFIAAMEVFLDIYVNVLKGKVNNNYSSKLAINEFINLEINDIIKRVNVIMSALGVVKYNVNLVMLMESVIIKMVGDVYECSWC
ncbi:MAG: hypothetical protein Q4G04_01080 [bacterium]|nr:hypothetical protein [bacterium]